MDTNAALENSQRITDLRIRMLQNVQSGKAVDEGIDEATLKTMLDAVRSKRSEAWERGTKKKAGGPKTAKASGTAPPAASGAPAGPLSEKAKGLLSLLDAAAVSQALGK